VPNLQVVRWCVGHLLMWTCDLKLALVVYILMVVVDIHDPKSISFWTKLRFAKIRLRTCSFKNTSVVKPTIKDTMAQTTKISRVSSWQASHKYSCMGPVTTVTNPMSSQKSTQFMKIFTGKSKFQKELVIILVEPWPLLYEVLLKIMHAWSRRSTKKLL
jgi:hypothetical protein